MPDKTIPSVATLKPKQLKVIEQDSELVAARFSPCGKFIFAGSYDAHVYRWELADGTKTTLGHHNGWIQGLAFHSDGTRCFTGDSWGGICCWDYAEKTPEPKWSRADAHPRWMHALAISPDGALLATCGADKVVRLWSSSDGSPKGESAVLSNDLLSLCFHPQGKSLVVGDLKGVVTELELPALKVKRLLDAKILYSRPIVSGFQEINDVGGIRGLAFDASGALLACSGSQPATSGFLTGKPTIVILKWNGAAANGKETLQWEGVDPSEGITMDVAWHSAGYFLAGSSGQPGKGAFYCWKPGDPKPLHLDKKLTHCRSVSAHPDGQRVAVLQIQPRPGGINNQNGRSAKKDSEYFGLMSRITMWDMGAG